MTELANRIIEISKKLKLSHIGSCLSASSILTEIWRQKKSYEKFVLSAGHSALALYCILEQYGGRDAEEIFHHHGVHPDRCKQCGLDFSTGSLGMGICAATGMALADRTKNVWCMVSDGELAEGSCWEALRIAHDQKLTNLKIYVNANGYSAYDPVDLDYLEQRLNSFFPVNFRRTTVPEQFQGLKGHYITI